MADDFNRLKFQCDNLKLQRQTLSTECTTLQAERQTLNLELDKLQTERDSLRLELAKEHDQNTWWANKDMQASGSAALDFDGQGKLNRKIWVLETRNKELEKVIEESSDKRLKDSEENKTRLEKAIADERMVSIGLRDRIGRLEQKIRSREENAHDSVDREQTLKTALETQKAIFEQRIAEMEVERQDVRESLQREKIQFESLQNQLSSLIEEKQNLQEELRSLQCVKPIPTT